jgi:copper homeostasis protein
MKIEICTQCINSVLHAKACKIDQIELCSALEMGGITPSYGLIKEARNVFERPIFVLIRPRVGDFYYSDLELSVMEQDIIYCKEMNIDGIVIGALNKQQEIDLAAMQRFIKKAYPMEVVFHRAFDRMNEFENAIETLVSLGIKRILTSGQMPDAEKGISNLKKIMEKANGRIEIMVGGGITSHNVGHIVAEVRPDALHFSAKKRVTSDRSESNEDEIKAILKKIYCTIQ